MRMYDIIQKKKLGKELSREEIHFFIEGYTKNEIPDYQASAFTMAVCFQGMTDMETAYLTEAMAKSGDQMDLTRFGDRSCDKHSTGGVGDKTSLLVAPIMASLGAKMAKMTGRGLGHTGGTVDKLESIPGYNAELGEEAFLKQVDKIGIALIGQTGNLTPADKRLYALRDVTATVDSIPLIVSSIMSKKLAAGAHNIVLDVKVGSGAFMKTVEDAEKLARKMVDIGRLNGRQMAAVLTDMNVPLGFAVGNNLEVKEAVSVLSGQAEVPDLLSVVETLASSLARLVFNLPFNEALEEVREALRSGAAFEKMKEWISAQGGDVSYLEHPEKFPVAAYSYDVLAKQAGYIGEMNAEAIGTAAVMLGAGRAQKTDSIDPAAGIMILKKTGDYVEEGEAIATLLTNKRSSLQDAQKAYLDAVLISSKFPGNRPLIYKIIS